MQLLSVLLSFVLYLLLSEMAVNLLAGISYPIALVINLILNLLITCYMRTTVCAYYEARMKEKSAFEPAQTSELEDETGME